jgi:tetratricopeptide (TPR) repeat protein
MNTTNDEANVRGALAAWLSVTRTLEPYSGLGPREARRRAGELLQLILRGDIHPSDFELSEDFKDVLSALVGSLRDSGPLDQRCQVADSVYQFIARLPWRNPEESERRDFLYETAEAGWGDLDAVYNERWANQSRREPPLMKASLAKAVISQAGTNACRALSTDSLQGEARVRPISSAVAVLWQFSNSLPADVARQSQLIFSVGERFGISALFDEKDHLLGELSLLAGTALRQTGRWSEAGHWYSKASTFFGRTLRPTVGLIRIACERAALDYETRNYSRAIATGTALQRLCQGEALARERLKCQLVIGDSLHDSGRVAEAISVLTSMRSDPDIDRHPTFLVALLVKFANALALQQRYGEASRAHAEAFERLSKIHAPIVRADQKAVLAESLRDQGNLSEAVALYRMAIDEYTKIESMSLASYLRVVLAETLVALGRYSEAALELQEALPTIDHERMTSDGVAALALLKEALRRQNVEPKALRELRENLQIRR